MWTTSTREISRSFLYYYPANEGIQPTAKTRCKFLFFLSQSPLLEYNIHPHTIAAIHFPHKRGLPSREKTLT